MFVFLPKGDDVAKLENSISAEKIKEWRNGLQWQEVNVFFPRFKFNTGYSLGDDLMKMGMPTAFGSDADFSGMDGTGGLSIAMVVHKAYVDVYEEGTEAAAATGVGMVATGMPIVQPPKIFRADHPFIFAITDDSSGNILFLGRVSDPSQQ